MAKNKSTVYLGYEDEYINEKNKHLVDFTTNKIGGSPIWPNSDITVQSCPICGLRRPLVLQIYAPLDNSQFHRTLYIFSCTNAICSNQSKGWLCIRVQQIDKSSIRDRDLVLQSSEDFGGRQRRGNNCGGNGGGGGASANINWCSGADDWGDSDDFGTTSGGGSGGGVGIGMGGGGGGFGDDYCCDEENSNEQNGNFVNRNDNNRMSDEDDESNSIENDPIPGFGSLQVDDKNANCGDQGGAVGRLNSPNAYAEIEGEESELVTIDTPQAPQRDLIALLKQTSAVPMDQSKIIFKSFFINVDEERRNNSNTNLSPLTEHVRELLQEYQKNDDSPSSPCGGGNLAIGGGGGGGGGDSDEKYERTIPKHGDIYFHNFLEIICDNPGQIIRYSRDALPLLIAPVQESKPKCQNCGQDMICEIQILPHLIPKLRFINGDPAPIEYGNILIYTCQQSCWDTPDKMRLELVIVQQAI